jgi:transcription elongation factor Elf1
MFSSFLSPQSKRIVLEPPASPADETQTLGRQRSATTPTPETGKFVTCTHCGLRFNVSQASKSPMGSRTPSANNLVSAAEVKTMETEESKSEDPVKLVRCPNCNTPNQVISTFKKAGQKMMSFLTAGAALAGSIANRGLSKKYLEASNSKRALVGEILKFVL